MKAKTVSKPNPKIEDIITAAVEVAVQKALQAGRMQNDVEVKDTFKATEKRLYALPTLMLKVENDRDWIENLRIHGAPERSNSIVRFGTSGVRLSEDEIVETLIIDTESKIAADEHEIITMQKALGTIENDSYYEIICLKYFNGENDEDIADMMNCDPSTVRRQKNRLVQRMSVFLYGARVVV